MRFVFDQVRHVALASFAFGITHIAASVVCVATLACDVASLSIYTILLSHPDALIDLTWLNTR